MRGLSALTRRFENRNPTLRPYESDILTPLIAPSQPRLRQLNRDVMERLV